IIGNAGALTANASTVGVSNLSMNGGTSGTITLTTGVWTVSGSWDSTGLGSILNSDTSTVTFTGTSQTIGLASGQMFYNLTIGGTVSTTSTVTAAGALTVNNGAVLTKTGQNLVFTMLASDPVVDVTLSAPCGPGNRYWIGGTGNWSQTTHWSSSSGGVNGCSVPNASNPVFFDANSGGGTVTVDLNAAMSSLNTTGWSGTVAIGVFDFAVGGGIIHAAGVLTIGASTANGLTATGGLTLSGSAILDG